MPAGPGTYGSKKGRPKKSSKWAGATAGPDLTGAVRVAMGELLNMTKRKGKYPPAKKKRVASPKSPKVRAHTLHERAKDAKMGKVRY